MRRNRFAAVTAASLGIIAQLTARLCLFKREFCSVILVFLFSLSLALSVNIANAQGSSRGWHRIDKSSEVALPDSQPLYKRSYALLIGASAYQTWPRLPTISHELDTVQEALEAHQFEVQRLVDPDGQALKRGMEDFVNEYGYDPENRLLIFFSGHGHSIGDKGFILPVDSPLPTETKAFRRKALPMTQVLAWARDIESKHVLFVFDSCFSGTVFSSKSLPSSGGRYIREATSEPVRQFITAGGANDEVPAKSTFTPMFVKALQGEGDLNGDGYITGSELGVHLAQQVPQHVDQTPQYGKIRDYDLSQGDFVFELESSEPLDGSGADSKNSEVINAVDTTRDSEFELELWKSASQFDGREHYEAYLQQYPDGNFATIARLRIASISSQNTQQASQQLSNNNRDIQTLTPVNGPGKDSTWQAVTSGSSPVRNRGETTESGGSEQGWIEIESDVGYGSTTGKSDEGWIDIQ